MQAEKADNSACWCMPVCHYTICSLLVLSGLCDLLCSGFSCSIFLEESQEVVSDRRAQCSPSVVDMVCRGSGVTTFSITISGSRVVVTVCIFLDVPPVPIHRVPSSAFLLPHGDSAISLIYPLLYSKDGRDEGSARLTRKQTCSF